MTTESQISEREREILRLVAMGATNQQIANQLSISVNTVKVHLRNIFGKIGVASRSEATLYAVRAGIVDVVLADGNVEAASAPAEPAQREPTAAAIEPQTPSATLPPAIGERDTPTSPPAERERMPQPAARTPADARKQRLVRDAIAVGTTLGALGLVVLVLWLLQPARPTSQTNPTATTSGSRSQVAKFTPIWMAHSDLSVAQSGAAATNHDGRIFVIGGRGKDGVSGAVWRYDPKSDTWSSLSAKPTPVTNVQAVVLNGKIYVPGGETADGKVSAALEVYDPAHESWSAAKDLPAPRSAYALAAVDGRLYLFGGWDGAQARPEVYMYDPQSNTWTTRTAMPTARAYSGAVVFEGSVYVVGGENGSGPLTANEKYTPANEGSQPWTPLAPLPKARSRFGAGPIANFVFVLGGQPESTPLAYDVRADSWQPSTDPPDAPIGAQPAVAARDTSLFVISGSDSAPSQVHELRQLYTVTIPSQP